MPQTAPNTPPTTVTTLGPALSAADESTRRHYGMVHYSNNIIVALAKIL